MTDNMKFKQVVEQFHVMCEDMMSYTIRTMPLNYEPVWQCDGKKWSQFECYFMVVIGENEGITVSELKRHWGRTQGAVSQHLIRFEKDGLIRKEKMQSDRRNTQIFLTERGKKVAKDVKKMKRIHNQEGVEILLAKGYSLEEVEIFCNVYKTLQEISENDIKRLYGKKEL